MGAKRTRSQGESDDRKKFSIPPGYESLTSFTLTKVGNSQEGPSQVASTSTIISTGKLKSSVRHRPWILDDHVDHMEEDPECEADKSSSSRACLPKGVIRGCYRGHNCEKVVARCRPELARIPSLDEAPVFHPTKEEFEDTLKYVASILPHVKHYGICRIVPPASWTPPCRIEEEAMRNGVDTRIQRISDLQSVFFKKMKMNNRQQKIVSMELKESGSCNEHFELESGPKFKLKSLKNYANYFKRQYFVKNSPSIPDIEGEYWRIIENPTEEIEVLHGKITETSASGFPHKMNPRDVTECPQYVESGWNLNNTPKLQDSLLRFESCNNSSILLPRLSIGMCFSSNHWTRVATEVRRRKYVCASLESQKMEDDFRATTKRECAICFYDLYLSAIGCKCSPHKYTCLLHAKQLCACAWSEKYLLIRYGIDELDIMVDALDQKVSAVHKWAKERLGLPVSDVSKDASKDGCTIPPFEMVKVPVIFDVGLSESMSHRLTTGRTSDIQQDQKNNSDPISCSSAGSDALTHRSQSKENGQDENKVLLPKISQYTAVGENIATSSNAVRKKHLARESSSTEKNVIILIDED